MKTTKLKFLLMIVAAVLLAGCDSELSTSSLKKTLDNNVQSLTVAINKISSSSDFQLMTEMTEASQNVGMLKTPGIVEGEYMPNDTVLISLDKISGVYEYSWKKVKANSQLLRFFTRTDDNQFMIVRLPVQKVRNPKVLFGFQPADTLLTNNFEASVSDYYVFRNRVAGNEYRLTSDFSIDNTKIGTLTELRTRNKVNGFNSSSVYALTSGYTVTRTENSGDTAQSVYAISEGSKVLYEEKMVSVKVVGHMNRHRENTYSLTIGDVQIVRQRGLNSLDSAKVYVAGILQTNAKVEVVINQPDSLNQCVTDAKRDLQITFDDGTVTTVRTLMGNTVDEIGKIFRAARQASFATDIIDRIAWNIYTRK